MRPGDAHKSANDGWRNAQAAPRKRLRAPAKPQHRFRGTVYFLLDAERGGDRVGRDRDVVLVQQYGGHDGPQLSVAVMAYQVWPPDDLSVRLSYKAHASELSLAVSTIRNGHRKRPVQLSGISGHHKLLGTSKFRDNALGRTPPVPPVCEPSRVNVQYFALLRTADRPKSNVSSRLPSGVSIAGCISVSRGERWMFPRPVGGHNLANH